jgi:hypothetical protein
MSSLFNIFKKREIALYQNECIDLDHYHLEDYQDSNDEIQVGIPFETNTSKKKRKINLLNKEFSNFHFFMDGSRRTYKIGDIVIHNNKIFPVVVAQIRAGCTHRDNNKRLHAYKKIKMKNLLLLTDKINEEDFGEIKNEIESTHFAKDLKIEVTPYKYSRSNAEVPVDAAVAKAQAEMHDMEIKLLSDMVHSSALDTNKMLIVDGPLQFLKEDTRTQEFEDLFYNVVGVSKSFNPMLSTSTKRRGGTQIGAEVIKLNYGERTPVIKKVNDRDRIFGCWYLRIRHREYMSNPLEGVIKIEKMAMKEDIEREGLDTDIVDNISMSLMNEGNPTCFGNDNRWASHLYPIYLTEQLIKSTLESDFVFMNQFKKNLN